jgi:hypothetical protein
MLLFIVFLSLIAGFPIKPPSNAASSRLFPNLPRSFFRSFPGYLYLKSLKALRHLKHNEIPDHWKTFTYVSVGTAKDLLIDRLYPEFRAPNRIPIFHGIHIELPENPQEMNILLHISTPENLLDILKNAKSVKQWQKDIILQHYQQWNAKVLTLFEDQ